MLDFFLYKALWSAFLLMKGEFILIIVIIWLFILSFYLSMSEAISYRWPDFVHWIILCCPPFPIKKKTLKASWIHFFPILMLTVHWRNSCAIISSRAMLTFEFIIFYWCWCYIIYKGTESSFDRSLVGFIIYQWDLHRARKRGMIMGCSNKVLFRK